MGLYVVLELGQTPQQATKLIQRATTVSMDFQWLEPPSSMGAITIVDVHAAREAEEYKKAVHEWARSVWNEWRQYHATVRECLRKVEKQKS
jgi:hypothetical protein